MLRKNISLKAFFGIPKTYPILKLKVLQTISSKIPLLKMALLYKNKPSNVKYQPFRIVKGYKNSNKDANPL